MQSIRTALATPAEVNPSHLGYYLYRARKAWRRGFYVGAAHFDSRAYLASVN